MIHKYVRDLLVFLATIDPFTTLSVFLAVTAESTPAESRRIARRAIFFATGVLVAAIAIGQLVLTAMHVSQSSFRIAGGIVLFLFAVKMLFGTAHGAPGEHHGDLAVFPLATPTIAGPGAILAAIMLTDNDLYTVDIQVGSTLILLVILALNYLAMRGAVWLHRIIGRGGAEIIGRVMGLILASLAVETVMQGISIAIDRPLP